MWKANQTIFETMSENWFQLILQNKIFSLTVVRLKKLGNPSTQGAPSFLTMLKREVMFFYFCHFLFLIFEFCSMILLDKHFHNWDTVHLNEED